MYKVSDKILTHLCKEYSRAMVGRLCKQIESLQKDLDKNSEEFKYLNHAKNLRREFIYETFRDLKNEIKTYNSGLKFTKFNVTPSMSTKC